MSAELSDIDNSSLPNLPTSGEAQKASHWVDHYKGFGTVFQQMLIHTVSGAFPG